jgi:hypothetical protein
VHISTASKEEDINRYTLSKRKRGGSAVQRKFFKKNSRNKALNAIEYEPL